MENNNVIGSIFTIFNCVENVEFINEDTLVEVKEVFNTYKHGHENIDTSFSINATTSVAVKIDTFTQNFSVKSYGGMVKKCDIVICNNKYIETLKFNFSEKKHLFINTDDRGVRFELKDLYHEFNDFVLARHEENGSFLIKEDKGHKRNKKKCC
jgi:hypothetical protein